MKESILAYKPEASRLNRKTNDQARARNRCECNLGILRRNGTDHYRIPAKQTMKSQSVNYYLLESILTLMEGVDMMGRFDFSNFDPDDEADVSKLVVKIIKPSLDRTSLEKRAAIARSIAYYTTQGNAPFYDMAAGCQELSMIEATSWPIFFDRIGLFAFGPDYKLQYLPNVVEERLDLAEAELIWAPRK